MAIYIFRNSIAMAKLASDVVYSTGFYNKSKMFIETEVLHVNESIIWKLFGDE